MAYTRTNNKDHDDFFPTVSDRGDVISWISDYDYVDDKPITSANQVIQKRLL